MASAHFRGWIMLGCAFALVACGVLPWPGLPGYRAEASTGVWKDSPPTEAAILADRILRRRSDDLLFDVKQRGELIAEIEQILSQIRDAYPAMMEVGVRGTHQPRTLLIGLKPDLFEAVAGPTNGQEGSAVPRTGHVGFDTLNASLGLQAVELFPLLPSGPVIFHFGEHLNIDAAIRAYTAIEGVEYAEPNAFLGDGSDIDAYKSRGTWYVVVRKAWGDCPSGCLYQELFFFTVEGGEVDQIEGTQAMNMAAFAELVAARGW